MLLIFSFGIDFLSFFFKSLVGHLFEYLVGLCFLNCACEMLGEVLLDFLFDFR